MAKRTKRQRTRHRSTLLDRDLGYWDMVKAIEGSTAEAIFEVGTLSELVKTQKNPLQYAHILEFGGHIWFRPAFDANRRKFMLALRDIADGVIAGKPGATEEVAKVADQLVQALQKSLRDKGMVDTGALYSSIGKRLWKERGMPKLRIISKPAKLGRGEARGSRAGRSGVVRTMARLMGADFYEGGGIRKNPEVSPLRKRFTRDI